MFIYTKPYLMQAEPEGGGVWMRECVGGWGVGVACLYVFVCVCWGVVAAVETFQY